MFNIIGMVATVSLGLVALYYFLKVVKTNGFRGAVVYFLFLPIGLFGLMVQAAYDWYHAHD